MWLVAPARWHRARSHSQGVTLGSQRGSEATQIVGGSASSRGHGWWWLAGSVLRTRGVFGRQNHFAAPPTPVQPPQDGFRGVLPKTGCSSKGDTHPSAFPLDFLDRGSAAPLQALAHPRKSLGTPCPRPPRDAPGNPFPVPSPSPGNTPGHPLSVPSPTSGCSQAIPSPRPPQGCSWASPPLCPLWDVPGHSMLLPSPAFGMFMGIPSPCPRPPQG